MEIIYTGLEQQTLQWLINGLKGELQFIHLTEQHIINGDKVLLERSAIVLIGEKASNPIRLAQAIFQLDRCISILLINEEINHRKIKQALLFTPFVGPTIVCVSTQAKKGLALVVNDHLLRTEQRRNYAKIKAPSLSINSPTSNTFERIKQQYTEKVLEQAPIGIILLNGETIIQSFNQYAAGLFDTSEKEVLGKKFTALFSEQELQEIEGLLKQKEPSSKKKQ
jgi:PAS domain-containing protein